MVHSTEEEETSRIKTVEKKKPTHPKNDCKIALIYRQTILSSFSVGLIVTPIDFLNDHHVYGADDDDGGVKISDNRKDFDQDRRIARSEQQ